MSPSCTQSHGSASLRAVLPQRLSARDHVAASVCPRLYRGARWRGSSRCVEHIRADPLPVAVDSALPSAFHTVRGRLHRVRRCVLVCVYVCIHQHTARAVSAHLAGARSSRSPRVSLALGQSKIPDQTVLPMAKPETRCRRWASSNSSEGVLFAPAPGDAFDCPRWLTRPCRLD